MGRLIACARMTFLIGAGFAAALMQTVPAAAFDRVKADLFAVLPDGATGPEGLAVAPNGDVYVATFGLNASGLVAPPGKMYVFNDNGQLLRTLSVIGSSAQLIGIGFHPTTGDLLVIDFGHAKVLKVDKQTGGASDFITLASPGGAGLNALTFDSSGNVYVSDSFQGAIWKAPAGGALGLVTPWVQDPLLTTTGVPPFGANGVGFNKAGTTLFVANTGNDTVVQIPVSSGVAGSPSVFVNSINGADGLVIDANDNIWVCANQSDVIIVLDPTGKVIGELGGFEGLKDGTPQGLLFPASPDFSKDGKWLFVTNLELDLRSIGGPQTVDSQWAAQVRRHSIAKVRARILGFDND